MQTTRHVRRNSRRNARRLAWSSVLLMIVASLVVSPASPAQSYALFGCKHTVSNVRYIANSVPSGYAPSLNTARINWSSTDVTLTKVTSGDAAIVVVFKNFGNVSWSGWAQGSSTCQSNGYYTYPWAVAVKINRYHTDAYPVLKKQGVIIHELGHAIGLAHTGAFSCSIMTPTDNQRYDVCSTTLITTDDRNGANFLY